MRYTRQKNVRNANEERGICIEMVVTKFSLILRRIVHLRTIPIYIRANDLLYSQLIVPS